MSNSTKNRILIERLKNDSTTELMPNDLNEMLNRELSKPAKDVDTQLVRDLLDLMEEEIPSQESKDECWKAIQMHGQKKSHRGRYAILRHISAVAAALVIIVFVSYGTAQAFNWTFLLKLLSPFTQTFGIYSANNPVNHVDANDRHEYIDEDVLLEQINYTELKDMPHQLKGYTIVPGWIPDRYSFESGSIFEDTSIVVASMFFRNNDEFLSLSISFYEQEEDATAYVYEVYTESENSIQVADQSVTYYYNDSGEICAASAVAQNVHVYIGGSISENELEQIIASMN